MASLHVSLMRSPPSSKRPSSPISIHGLPVWEALRHRCEANGWTFGFGAPPAGRPAVVLWDFGSLARRPLTRDGSREFVAWSLESPLVAHRAYHRLDSISREASYVLGFPGVAALVADDGAPFGPIFWPNTLPVERSHPAWSERRLAVMINSNKAVRSLRGQIDLREPYRSARRAAAALLATTYRLRAQWQVPDLYQERLRLIEAFSSDPGFDLYGIGWDASVAGASTHFRAALARCHRGAASDKHETLSGYRFALCLENTRFPGYISEKLFDCFFTGTIPVYLGAPDVADYIPKDTFISADSHADYHELLTHLRNLDAEEVEMHLSAAKRFRSSAAFKRFTEDQFLGSMMSAIEAVSGYGRG